MRWIAVVLVYIYNIDEETVHHLLGCSTRSIKRWIRLFNENGNVEAKVPVSRGLSLDSEVKLFMESYTIENPCFYLEELATEIRDRFNVSPSFYSL